MMQLFRASGLSIAPTATAKVLPKGLVRKGYDERQSKGPVHNRAHNHHKTPPTTGYKTQLISCYE